MTEYAKPLVSHSMAVHPDQIATHREHFPNIEITKEGQPVFHSVAEHDKYLKANKWTKTPQRKKRRGKKINA